MEFAQKWITITKPTTPNGHAKTKVTCPVCKGVFSIREFKDHIRLNHKDQTNHIGMELFGLYTIPKCTKCNREMRFDINNLRFPKHCTMCPARDILYPSEKELESPTKISSEIENLQLRIKELKLKKKQSEIENKFKQLKLEDLPIKGKGSNTFLKKLEYELRISVVEHDWNNVTRIVNLLHSKLME